MKILPPLLVMLSITALSLAGCSTHKEQISTLPEPVQNNPIWGEGEEAQQEYLDVSRISPERPDSIGVVYYSMTPPKGSQIENPSIGQGRIGFSIIDRYGKKIPIFQQDGNYYIHATKGQRYSIYFENLSNIGYEVLVTADGLDSITGKEGKYSNAGYILFPAKHMTIKGFRQTQQDFKPFVFNHKPSAYVLTKQDSANHIGVIGFAIFKLKTPSINKEQQPKAFPGQTNMFRLDK